MDRNNGVAETTDRLNGTVSTLRTEDALELHFDDHRLFTELLGQHDAHMRTIEQALGVRIGSQRQHSQSRGRTCGTSDGRQAARRTL